MKDNTQIWDQIYSEGRSWLEAPCEDLVAYFNYCTKNDDINQKNVLDLGFGAGNNLNYLYRKGLKCFGLEVSSIAKEKLGKSLEHINDIDLKLYNGTKFPYKNNFFDYIVAWHSMTYNTSSTIETSINEVHRVMKPKGKAFIAMITPRDIAPQTGIEISEHTYQMNTLTGQKGAKVYVFKDETHIKKKFNIFNFIDIGYCDFMKFGRLSSHWLIALEKK